MGKLTDAEKDGLSAEEIAAIEEDDEGLDDLKTSKELEAEEAAAKAKAEAEAKEKAESEAKQIAEDDKSSRAHREKPMPALQLPTVDEEKLENLKLAYEDAKEKWEDGDIDYTEFSEAKDAYNEVKWKKEFAEESNASMRENRWIREQESFLDANTVYRDNPALNAAFVTAVNRLIATDEGAAMSDRQVLEAARDKVEKDLGAVRTKPKRADQHHIPAGIADVQTADETGDKSNEFAHLDKLEGEAYQAAIDKLTPAQLERYENTQ